MQSTRGIGLIVGLFLFVAACGDGATEEEKVVEPRVMVEDFQFTLLPGGARIVTGKLHNRTDGSISNAQIQISLYDKDNLPVTTMHVVVRNIGPDEHKAFREAVDADDRVQRARVRSVLVL